MLTRLLAPALLLAGVSCAPPALADGTEAATRQHGGTVCAILDHDPTTTGLENAVYYLMGLGYELMAAADIAVLAVHGYCPAHMPVVEELALVSVLV